MKNWTVKQVKKLFEHYAQAAKEQEALERLLAKEEARSGTSAALRSEQAELKKAREKLAKKFNDDFFDIVAAYKRCVPVLQVLTFLARDWSSFPSAQSFSLAARKLARLTAAESRKKARASRR